VKRSNHLVNAGTADSGSRSRGQTLTITGEQGQWIHQHGGEMGARRCALDRPRVAEEVPMALLCACAVGDGSLGSRVTLTVSQAGSARWESP